MLRCLEFEYSVDVLYAQSITYLVVTVVQTKRLVLYGISS